MNKQAVLKITILVLLILACIVLFFHFHLYAFFFSRRQVTEFVSSFGPLSVAIFIGLQILQVILAPIPGEVNGFIGGYLYGPLLGTLYSTVGLTLGSWLAFTLARWLGLPFVEKVVNPALVQKYDYFMEHRGKLVTLVLFIIPGFPKDALSYIVGLSHMKAGTFMAISTAGRLLGTVMLSVSGHCARNNRPGAMTAILAVSALIVLLAYVYHGEIHSWLKRRHRPEKG